MKILMYSLSAIVLILLGCTFQKLDPEPITLDQVRKVDAGAEGHYAVCTMCVNKMGVDSASARTGDQTFIQEPGKRMISGESVQRATESSTEPACEHCKEQGKGTKPSPSSELQQRTSSDPCADCEKGCCPDTKDTSTPPYSVDQKADGSCCDKESPAESQNENRSSTPPSKAEEQRCKCEKCESGVQRDTSAAQKENARFYSTNIEFNVVPTAPQRPEMIDGDSISTVGYSRLASHECQVNTATPAPAPNIYVSINVDFTGTWLSAEFFLGRITPIVLILIAISLIFKKS